jgi:hypothetical protein
MFNRGVKLPFYITNMLKIKSLIVDIRDVPREWIFEYYLQIGEKLTGQDVKLKSAFNPNDKTPSMYIYYSSSEVYKYKDFSTGKQGDAINLVQELHSLTSRGETAHKIIEDYNQYVLNNKDDTVREFKKRSKYQISSFSLRNWTNLDEKFWSKFHIGSKLLEFYKVSPLEEYKLTKEEEGDVKEVCIKGHNIYGYFRKDGSLYKIYHPYVKDYKFIKVKDYIQGSDQLTMKVPYLVICSSLKDVMAFRKMGYKNAEAIAPDSENSMIPEHVMNAYKFKYQSIVTLFDNDQAGIESMKKYELKYNIPYVLLELSKDLSDSLRDHGVNKTRDTLTPLIKEKLNKTLVS